MAAGRSALSSWSLLSCTPIVVPGSGARRVRHAARVFRSTAPFARARRRYNVCVRRACRVVSCRAGRRTRAAKHSTRYGVRHDIRVLE